MTIFLIILGIVIFIVVRGYIVGGRRLKMASIKFLTVKVHQFILEVGMNVCSMPRLKGNTVGHLA